MTAAELGNVFTPEFQTLVVGVAAALILGGLRYAAPLLKDRVPKFLWPLAVIVLAKVGTQACEAAGALCQGNPLEWSQAEANAMAAALTGLVGHQMFKGARRAQPKVLEAARKWANGGTPPPKPPRRKPRK